MFDIDDSPRFAYSPLAKPSQPEPLPAPGQQKVLRAKAGIDSWTTTTWNMVRQSTAALATKAPCNEPLNI